MRSRAVQHRTISYRIAPYRKAPYGCRIELVQGTEEGCHTRCSYSCGNHLLFLGRERGPQRGVLRPRNHTAGAISLKQALAIHLPVAANQERFRRITTRSPPNGTRSSSARHREQANPGDRGQVLGVGVGNVPFTSGLVSLYLGVLLVRAVVFARLYQRGVGAAVDQHKSHHGEKKRRRN